MDVQEEIQAISLGMSRPSTIVIPSLNDATKASGPFSPASVLVGYHDDILEAPASPTEITVGISSSVLSPALTSSPISPLYPPPRPPGHRKIKRTHSLIRSLSEGSSCLALKHEMNLKTGKPLQRSISNILLSGIHSKEEGKAAGVSTFLPTTTGMCRRTKLRAWMSSLFQDLPEPQSSHAGPVGGKTVVEEVNVDMQKLPKKDIGTLHVGRLVFVLLIVNALFAATVVLGMKNGNLDGQSSLIAQPESAKVSSDLPGSSARVGSPTDKAPLLPSPLRQSQGSQEDDFSSRGSVVSATRRKLLAVAKQHQRSTKKTPSSSSGESKIEKIAKALHISRTSSTADSMRKKQKKTGAEWVRVWQQYWVDKANIRAGGGIQLVDETALVAQAEGEDFSGESASTSELKDKYDVKSFSSKTLRGAKSRL